MKQKTLVDRIALVFVLAGVLFLGFRIYTNSKLTPDDIVPPFINLFIFIILGALARRPRLLIKPNRLELEDPYWQPDPHKLSSLSFNFSLLRFAISLIYLVLIVFFEA
ncbi:MAG: hypothetical protein EOO15_00250 [Chitinophagaceae bacterium]|nr:MAG: hypothetical protein EOO15_00250 [Chitinophagaceae bacterium]